MGKGLLASQAGLASFKPQTINSILRLQDRLRNNWNRDDYTRREGYMIELGNARALSFSAEPTANVVGATADLLLEGDEAQDITPEKWYRDFMPMATSTSATTVLYGTARTTDTLLARTIQHLRRQEAADGIRRVFTYDADQVGHHVPDYKRCVDAQVRRLGRNHPLIRTQYYLETIDGQAGLFPRARRALMRGQHPRQHESTPGHRYALLLDIAGEEESAGDCVTRAMLQNKKRDATALTVAEVQSRPHDPPVYRVADRRLWLGVRHKSLYDHIRHLCDHWRAAFVVVEVTNLRFAGISASLASFLQASLERTQCALIPVVFSSKTKSDLGWDFVGAIETGRFQEYLEDGAPDTRLTWHEVLPGPGERIRWGVWDPPTTAPSPMATTTPSSSPPCVSSPTSRTGAGPARPRSPPARIPSTRSTRPTGKPAPTGMPAAAGRQPGAGAGCAAVPASWTESGVPIG